MDVIENAKKILKKYNQNSILKLLENLEDEPKEKLCRDIISIDFKEIMQLYNNKEKIYEKKPEIAPINYIDKEKLTEEEKEQANKIGEEIIKNNQYAVVTMAGGQGTRLGCKGPKGAFKLDIGENGKYIFEILVDTLKRARKKYGISVYWYIMTSQENYKQTIEFLEEHKYFGYDKNKVKFFKQSVLPLIDSDGDVLINEKYEVKKASNGNGGVFKALKQSKILDDMEEKNIKWVYICGVDNIMVNMVDPILLGLTIKNNFVCASKSVKKAYPEEKVGIFCKKNGKPAVIEYIEMTDDMIYSRKDGELVYGESNIISHLFRIDALKKIAEHNLKYHCAMKKNNYLDENAKIIIPEFPNSYKFEAFIFDGFEFINDMLVMRVKREEEFAPIKNKVGVDSPDTAKEIYNRYFYG